MLAKPNPNPNPNPSVKLSLSLNLRKRQKRHNPKPRQRPTQKRLKTVVKKRVRRRISDAAPMGIAIISRPTPAFLCTDPVKLPTGSHH